LPANQGGSQDLKDELDTLFNHPNTGPFISRQLIQRLVTSNKGTGPRRLSRTPIRDSLR
jgi:uncharacterized protein (DUF1800 family)